MIIFKKKRFVICKEYGHAHRKLCKCDLEGAKLFFKYNTSNFPGSYPCYVIKDKQYNISIVSFDNCKKYLEDIEKNEIKQ